LMGMAGAERRRRGETIIGAVVLAALTVAVGVFVLAASAGWLGATLQATTREANKSVLLVKTSAQLAFEGVHITSAERKVVLRNIADVSLLVTRVEVVGLDGGLKASYPPVGFAKIVEIPPSENATLREDVVPPCPSCGPLSPLRLRVWYIASPLFEEDNPLASADEMRYVETLFNNPPGEATPRCPLPSNWMTVDVVDPVTYFDTGKIPSSPNNQVYIRFPRASTSTYVSVDIQVIDVNNNWGTGSRVVESVSNELQAFTGSFENFQSPLRILIFGAGYEVIQREWVLGGIPNKAHASGVTLWSDAVWNVGVLEVELGVNDLVGGRYVVTALLYDCNGDLLASRSVTISVPVGIFSDQVFIDVPPTPLTDIAKVEIRVEEG